jgi:hypothetical protein
MRTLLTPLFLCALIPAEAARLQVGVTVSDAQVVLRRTCPDAFDPNPTMPLGANGAASVSPYTERVYPGSVMVLVRGGVPPYRYDWHGLMADGSVCSAMPGRVRVTVSDATGRAVTRVVNVRERRTVLPAPCGEVPLVTDPAVKRTGTGKNYFGSAKPVHRTKPSVIAPVTGPSVVRVRSTPVGEGLKREVPKVLPATRTTR